MLKSKPRIRTDYHELISRAAPLHEEKFSLWLKAAFILVFGFVLGLLCAKYMSSFRSETLASNTNNNNAPQVMADQSADKRASVLSKV